MNKVDLKQAEEIKNKIVQETSKGPKHYFRTVGLIVLVMIGIFIITNPVLLKNPSEYFNGFDPTCLYTIFILCLIVFGVYRIGKNMSDESRQLTNENISEQIKKDRETEEEIKEERHITSIKKRMEVGPSIANYLKSLLINLPGANRVTICELHNGSNNMSGCPFLHYSITYEEISSENNYIIDEFKNFNLLKSTFITNHFNDATWVGSVDEICDEDNYLGTKIKLSGDEYMGIIVLQGNKFPIGFLTVAFDNEHPSKDDILAEMSEASQKITPLLEL